MIKPRFISDISGDKLLLFRYKLKKLLSLLPIREKRIASSFEDLNLRAKFYENLWQESAAKLGFKYEKIGYGYWSIQSPDGRRVRGTLANVEMDSEVAIRISGNKPLCHKILHDIPDYRAPEYCEFNLKSLDIAREFLDKQENPCVIKPASDTGAGAGVVTGVKDEDTLRDAAIFSSVYCKNLLIEETISGNSYRLLYLNGEYIHGIQRNPPRIIGDGVSSIKSLIKAENQRRSDSSRIVSLFPISIDQDCIATLKAQSYTLHSVPGKGDDIIVKQVINQNSSDQNINITKNVHPSIIELGAIVSSEIGISISGVDVLTTDISIPLKDSGGVINEVNGNPGLHHHYLTSSLDDPGIAEKIINYCLDKSIYRSGG